MADDATPDATDGGPWWEDEPWEVEYKGGPWAGRVELIQDPPSYIFERPDGQPANGWAENFPADAQWAELKAGGTVGVYEVVAEPVTEWEGEPPHPETAAAIPVRLSYEYHRARLGDVKRIVVQLAMALRRTAKELEIGRPLDWQERFEMADGNPLLFPDWGDSPV